MTPAALPVDEAARLEALRGLHLLDTSPEERFDRITRVAAQLFGVSISVISLVDANRQWFKSRFGLDAAETPREVSFCGHAILQDDVFVVPDTLQDARFADNPLVLGDPKIRFYAGTPLRSKGGAAVGTLCLIDSKPREFSEADRKLLTGLAHWAEQTLTRTEQASLAKRAGRWWAGALPTALAVGLFELLSAQLFYIPNPPALLLIAVVFAAYQGGIGAGIVSSAIAWAYLAHFFSLPGAPFQYTGDNLVRVLTWAVAMPAIAVMTGLLQRRSARLAEAETADAVMAMFLTERSKANAELRKSHDQLLLVTDNAPIHIIFYDTELRCRYANRSYARWLGTEVSQMIGKTVVEIFGEQAVKTIEPLIHRVFAGERLDLEREHRHPDGRVSHLAVSLIPQSNGGGAVDGFYAFNIDITERKNAALEIAAAKERLALALTGSNLCLWDLDCVTGSVYLDETWARMLGEEPNATVTTVQTLLAQTHPDDGDRLLEVSLQAMKGDTEGYAEEHRVRNRDGEWIWIASSGKVVKRGPDGTALRMIGTNADITARKRAEERIELLATQDPLTSLPNRRVLTDRLNHAMLTAERKDKAFFALLFIDLDRFKIINDSLGHNVGDQLLKQVAERITGAIRKGDTLGRLGGDEFAVLLEHLHNGEAAGPVARKIIEAFALPYDVEGHMLNVSCSIGISVFPSDTDDAAMLLRNADLAMYSAKERGRNTYQYFSQEMNQLAACRTMNIKVDFWSTKSAAER